MIFKNIIVLSTLLASASLQAESDTIAKLDSPYKRIQAFRDATFYSQHGYTVSNNTAFTKSISVCYDLITCPEWQYHVKSVRDCIAFDLQPWETKSDRKTISLTVNYGITGWCHVKAITETTGGTPSKSEDVEMFEIRYGT